MKNTFSVVIPLYNKEKHITRALYSVLNQTYRDFEIIIVNDASTDESLQLVKKVKCNNIKIFNRNKPGPGGYAARNMGIKKARSEYIAFLDADDQWNPQHLEKIVELIEKFPHAGIFCANYYRKDHKDMHINKYYTKIGKKIGEHIIKKYFYKGKYWPTQTSFVVVRKNIFEEVGYFPEGKCHRNGDIETWMRIALKYAIAWTPYLGGVYYMDSDNMITRKISYLEVPYIKRSAQALCDELSKEKRLYVKKMVNISLRWRIIEGIKKNENVSVLLSEYYKEIDRLDFLFLNILAKMPYKIIKLLLSFGGHS